jgi:hydrogenase-4 component B
MFHSSLGACLALIALWALIGLAGLLRPMSLGLVGRTLFPLGAVCGVALAVVAAMSLAMPAEQAVLPFGLPDLPVHVRRDALTSLFLLLLGGASAGISVFAAGYFRRGEGTAPGLMCLQYHLFLASVGFVGRFRSVGTARMVVGSRAARGWSVQRPLRCRLCRGPN